MEEKIHPTSNHVAMRQSYGSFKRPFLMLQNEDKKFSPIIVLSIIFNTS
jgi:hypothetical protein